jgi:hypothetical protein
LSISVFRAFLGENARPAREVGDPAWDRYWPGLLAEVDDALMWSSTGPATVPVQDGAGGCTQPAGACEVHHTKHKANGGKTSVKDCVLLCPFHHQVVIHRWGWTLVVNPDGTTTAWNKDKTKVLHSHGPPPAPGN